MAKQMMQDKASEMAATQTVPTGYKQTEVGVIPEDWDIKELQQICRVPITYGIVQCGPHIVNGIPYIRVSDMTARELDIDGMQRTSPQIAAAFARSTVDEGDIVYALRGKLGFVRSVPSSVAGANLTQGTARISPVPNVFGRYVFWALQSPRSLEQATQGAKGSTFVEITLASLKEIKIPVPRHKEEQKVIADALSDIDELIAGLEQLIAKKQAIKTAAMQQLLTGRTRLPAFALRPDGTPKGYKSSELGKIPEDWEVLRIAELGQVDPENLGSSTVPDYEFDYVSLEQVSKGTLIGTTKMTFRNAPSRARRILKRGDVLVSTVRPNLMSHYFVNTEVNDLICSTGFSVVRPSEGDLCPSYLYQHLFSVVINNQIEMLISGSNYPAINSTDVRQLKIQIGSFEEQTAIATILSDMDSELSALEQKLAKARDVKQGMMQQLLTGRIRLPLPQEA